MPWMLRARPWVSSGKRGLSSTSTRVARRPRLMLSVAERNRETIVVAYTHGQPAQPSTFAHYLGAFIEVLLRDMVEASNL